MFCYHHHHLVLVRNKARQLRTDRAMELVTGAMGSLLPKLGELLKDEYKLRESVRVQVQSLTRELETMHAALRKVAEVPYEQLDELVKLWARDVRELSYDMEDVIDTHLVRVENGCEATPNPNRLKKLMKKMCSLFSKGKARHQIADAIQDINKQIQEVANRHGRYTPADIVVTPAASTPIDPRLEALYREATELVGIYGKRDQELIKMLSEGDDVSKKKLKIVSVVGFGGLGKTTLVKAVYDKIKGDFDYRAFVSVGRNPDVKKVFKDILLKLNKKEYTKEVNLMVFDETMLIDEIREFLKNKRYLIIIDDIWDEETWRVIKWAFTDRNNLYSRLITTTRNVSVSEACCSSSDDKVYKMEPLSDDDSQRLFYQRIFSDRNGCPRELEQVSRDILKKCGGVPLAISTIASLLASKQIKTEGEWYAFLNSIGRGLADHACVEEMQRILSFSYYDLPSHLKTCLLYLSIFPEDSMIDRDQLIWRWIAEGFIQVKKQQPSLFEIGESYFNELINRSMIQPVKFDWDGSAEACRVHDMMLDLICALSSEENFVTILDGTEQSTPNSQSKVRRLSIQHSKVDETTPLVSMSQVRSITIFQPDILTKFRYNCFNGTFRPDISLMPPLSSFDVLRVLDLHECDLGKRSPLNLRDLGNLLHLRYLDLAYTNIHELPAEIGKLQFLQMLDVRGNLDLKELPSTVVKLRRLMRLAHNYCIRLPDGMENLTSVEWPNIVKEPCNLRRLRELNIFFHGDEPSLELEEAFVESLCNLIGIHSLAIGGCFRSMDLLGERGVPRRLQRFRSREAGEFSRLPAWVKNDLPFLSELCIAVKKLWQEDLQMLGMLPFLWSLWIESTHQVESLLVVSHDEFRRVKIFKLVLFGRPVQLMIQRGALPRAVHVECPLDVQWAIGNGFDFGLLYLVSLRHVCIILHCDGATVGEVKVAEAAVRHAVHVHPNYITKEIVFVRTI